MSTLIVLRSGFQRETSEEQADVQRALNAGSTFVPFPGLSDDHAAFTVRAADVVATVTTTTTTIQEITT